MRLVASAFTLVAILIGISLTRFYSFFLFHNLSVCFNVALCCGIFVIAWNARKVLLSHYLLFIGIGYLFVGGLDILHLLSSQGMRVFVGSGTNLSTQFWVAGQYVEAFSLLTATMFLDRKVSARLTFLAFSLITGLLLLSIFYWKIFPVCFLGGVGLTPFKVLSEYLICIVLVATIVILIKKADKFDKTVLILLVSSIVATIAQEIAFTKYMSVYGPSNVVGHLLKVVAFYLLYKAIVETSLVSPWNLLFGEFKQSEERLHLFIEHAPAALAMFDRQMRYISSSRRWLSDFNLGERNLEGLSHYEVFPEIGEKWKQIYRRALAGEVVHTEQDQFVRNDGSVRWLRWEVRPWQDFSAEIAGIVVFAEDITERKTAEQKLKESEERLRLLGDNLPESAVYQYTHQPGEPISFLYFSAGIERLNGVNPDDVLKDSSTLYRQIVPGYLERFTEAEKVCGREMSDFDMELPMRLPDGQLRWMRLHSRPRRTDDGRTIWDGVQTDVTGRKLMEEELRRSRDQFEFRVRERTKELIEVTEELREKAETIDLVQDAIFIRDHAGRVVFWSKGARETYGFTREEALGKKSHILLKATFPLAAEKIEQLVLETGEWKGEIRHTKANGERIVVDSRWAPQAGRNGDPPSFIEVNRDITAKKIGEEEFRKVDRALRTLSEFNQAMVRQSDEMELLRQACKIVADVGGYRLVWVGFANQDENKTVTPVASAGYDNGYLKQVKITWADEERGQGPCGVSIRTGKISVSQNAESNPVFSPWRFEALKRGFASSISLPLLVDASVIGALTIYASEPDAFDQAESNLLNDLAQNLSFGISSLRMAQQRRRSQIELRVYASRLEAINLELEDFAFIASHDLQEPLRKIQTFCGMAMKRCGSVIDDTGRQYLDRVSNSAERMRQLLRDLLEFSRITNRPAPFKRVDLCEITRAAADIFEQTIEETGCEIELENMPAIEADESQILQLFQNLISNSLKYRGSQKPRIRFTCNLDVLGMCEIVVEDNGIGFDQSFAERIFKPFQRLHKRSAYEGTGMGLAICRKIVERHGGSITAQSEPEKGSRFIIRLPVKHAELESVVEEQ